MARSMEWTATASSKCCRLQPISHGWWQTRPVTAGMGFSRSRRSSASSIRSCRSRFRYPSTSTPAGHAWLHGATPSRYMGRMYFHDPVRLWSVDVSLTEISGSPNTPHAWAHLRRVSARRRPRPPPPPAPPPGCPPAGRDLLLDGRAHVVQAHQPRTRWRTPPGSPCSRWAATGCRSRGPWRSALASTVATRNRAVSAGYAEGGRSVLIRIPPPSFSPDVTSMASTSVGSRTIRSSGAVISQRSRIGRRRSAGTP
jgi:hypothetical protein